MHTHRKHRGLRIGIPEIIALVLLVLVIVTGLWIWRIITSPPWPYTTGSVVSCELRSTHYNAEPNDIKVYLTYEYSVHSQIFIGNWEGFWPTAGSPNALPAERLHELEQPGYKLRIYYHPQNPAISRLDDGSRDFLCAAISAFAGLLVIFFIYLIKIYPTWRLP